MASSTAYALLGPGESPGESLVELTRLGVVTDAVFHDRIGSGDERRGLAAALSVAAGGQLAVAGFHRLVATESELDAITEALIDREIVLNVAGQLVHPANDEGVGLFDSFLRAPDNRTIDRVG